MNEKRVRRLMRIMGLEAICPKRKLSLGSPDHLKYPYLLKDLHPNQVFCADITYIRMAKGFYILSPLWIGIAGIYYRGSYQTLSMSLFGERPYMMPYPYQLLGGITIYKQGMD